MGKKIDCTKIKEQSRLSKVNDTIREYWRACKNMKDTETGERLLVLKPIHKDKVPTFTRHNGNRIKRLMDSGWRRPRSNGGNVLQRPKIGYKRPVKSRFRVESMGLMLKVIYNQRELMELQKIKDKSTAGVLASKIGAKKRQYLLEVAKKEKIPIYLS